MKHRIFTQAPALIRGFAVVLLLAVLATPAFAQVDQTTHVVYLHGRIVQQQGTNAVSPEYGPYLFDEIVSALGANGAEVHAPVRTGEPPIEQSATRVVELVQALLDSGVAPGRVVVVGASQGSIIAMLASQRLRNPQLRFVLLGACNAWVRDELSPELQGHVLSIYEEGDPYGHSCDPMIATQRGVSSFEEVDLHTGLSHGFLYRPLPQWVEPVLRWSELGVDR